MRDLIACATACLVALPALAADTAVGRPASPSAAAFESLKALEGEWRGRTETGDDVAVSYEVYANGTAVLERFVNAAHGTDDAMLTVYHLDGDELMLTHYCMVGNQPRMKAVDLSEGRVGFELIDATGLPSAGAGHMHRAAFVFPEKDRLNTAWTWREEGADRFTVRVQLERLATTTSR